ncbi:peptidoglycan binding domain protein, putative [Oceaniovalibus guishaninsula JLT2003]|uniref:Peptidoglycan binding domain protein, putative n=1 Tax=Oceaniovalibus guishaninsula JLT2003 TaxID=1231392 RepID=K2GL46_9RHOB|nr:L,D-transpeptidase family protein [Oceaniovalibus guishaninsula]EKE43496.1 peptidoglycan binding domain protein, putative [Oceaniovalibus guishaninsula JLT2003]
MRKTIRGSVAALAVAATLLSASHVSAGVTAFGLAVAEASADDSDLAAYYRDGAYRPLWVGSEPAALARRAALLRALDGAHRHGLPAGRYGGEKLQALLATTVTEDDRGKAEIALSKAFLAYARNIQSGVLVPNDVVPAIKREPPRRTVADLMEALRTKPADRLFRDLLPRSSEYIRLFREKAALEAVIAAGDWGSPLPERTLAPGQSGADVTALRDRLTTLGYLPRSAASRFDESMTDAVRAFQTDIGVPPDGVVGGATLAGLNVDPLTRLQSVIVAMERERWMPRDLGSRHIRVNLTDFQAAIIEADEVVFVTRSVIGARSGGRETPEFSDEMDHMVVNPSWYVPRSIVVGEYLPVLRGNPFALSHMQITDRSGRPVPRAGGFSRYTASSFPYSMRQPPGDGNALGRVKFMFPNKYNIYLHDTPSKSLFDRDVRAFSHGCVRLNDPFDFAYELLSMQSDQPEALFQSHLRTGRETRIDLERPVPVHLIYRTAIAKPNGGMQYRDDVYGRDAAILEALIRAGVALPLPRS